MTARYEVRILGPVDEASRLALQDLHVTVVDDGTSTVISVDLDHRTLRLNTPWPS